MSVASTERPTVLQATKDAAVSNAPPREMEIKFRADNAAFQKLLSSPVLKGAAVSPPKDLVSTYFDTAEKHLQAQGLALRVRKTGRAAPVMTLKWDGPAAAGPFSRGEVEVRCPGGVPDIQLLGPDAAKRVTDVTGDLPLAPAFATRVKRRTVTLRHGHSELEIALDDGSIVAGEARSPLAEVEVELKSGNMHDLLAGAAVLSREAALRLDFEAKSAKGYRIASGTPPRPQKAAKLELSHTVTFDDLLAAVLSNTLEHFVSNWASLRESDAPESIHQLRVALRRMRSTLGVFKRVIRLPELEDIRQEAKRIASALGPARECDAFRQNAMGGPLQENPALLKGATELLEAVEARRVESYAAARLLLEDAATTQFVLAVQGFIFRRAWRTAFAAEDLGLLTSEGRLFGAAVLDRLMRRAVKRGRHLQAMTDEERHELRIALKNLRYSVEFFGSLFEEGKSLRVFLKLVAELQEDLGAHNDAATARGFIDGLGLPADGDRQFASGYLLGWYRHATVVANQHLIGKWKSFRKADLFWE
jgi:triphosphatase